MTASSHVLVTGAGGFIGSALTRQLVDRGMVVRALVGPPGETATEPPAGVRAVRGDIADAALMRELASDCEIIIHAAGPPSVGASFDDPLRYVHAHVAGTTNVLHAARASNVAKLVYLSSAEIYGNAGPHPVDESHPAAPRSPYAAAKLAAEDMIRAFVNFSGLNACVLRPFSVYGPGQSSYSLVQSIARQARSGKAIEIADTKPVRDYCYIDDVVEAVVAACATPTSGFAPFNIGSGTGTTVLELVAAMLMQLGNDLPVVRNGAATRPPGAEIYALVADIGRANRILGWKPRTSLHAGLARVLEAARD